MPPVIKLIVLVYKECTGRKIDPSQIQKKTFKNFWIIRILQKNVGRS